MNELIIVRQIVGVYEPHSKTPLGHHWLDKKEEGKSIK